MTTLADIPGRAATSPPVSDITLLRRFSVDRDESAFAEITRRYAGMVYAACYRVLHNRQLAEDATQETFLRLMRRPQGVSLSLGGWLHKAATQMAIDVSRAESARRRRERTHSLEKIELLDDQKSWKEISETLDVAMLELPEEARDLLVQHFILGRPQREIANERSISIATVCRRVNDAMEQLRGVLRRQGLSAGAAMAVGDFMALRGDTAIPFTLQQELGKMQLLAGVRRGWRLIRPQPRGMSLWQLKELELAAVTVVGATLIVMALLIMLGKGKSGSGAGPTSVPEEHPAITATK